MLNKQIIEKRIADGLAAIAAAPDTVADAVAGAVAADWERLAAEHTSVRKVDRRVPIHKQAPAARPMQSNISIQKAAELALEDGAAAIQKANPKLTHAEAYVEHMKTPAGRELLKWHRDPRSRMTVSEFAEHERTIAARRTAGFETWSQAVDQQTKRIMKRDSIGYDAALRKVQIEMPVVFGEYLHERRA